MILLSSVAHAEDAARSAQKILTVAGMPHRLEQHDMQITVSIGISIYPDDGTDAETLLRNVSMATFLDGDSVVGGRVS